MASSKRLEKLRVKRLDTAADRMAKPKKRCGLTEPQGVWAIIACVVVGAAALFFLAH